MTTTVTVLQGYKLNIQTDGSTYGTFTPTQNSGGIRAPIVNVPINSNFNLDPTVTDVTYVFTLTAGSGLTLTQTLVWKDAEDSRVNFTDNTVGDVSPTKHGFAPKAPNDATKYLDGTGNYSTPTISGTTTVPNGGTGVTTTTSYGVLCGGITSTGAFQNAGAGTAGKVLTSNGISALPTWQAILPTITQVEIDFGSTPVPEGYFTITDAIVTTSTPIVASVAYVAPTGKDLDEVEMDDLEIRCSNDSGQFVMYIKAADGSYLADKFKINYLVG